MMQKLSILLTLVLLTGCDLIPAPLSGRRALKETARLIEISPRNSGSPGARQAAYHIASRLQSYGYRPNVDLFLSVCPDGETPFFNVTTELKGSSDQLIVIGSHFDTKRGIPDFQGANDSGSSTGLLLELARTLRYKKLKHSILFAFFDGEECMLAYGDRDGLHGSRHLAQQLSADKRDVAGVIILDMIGDKNLTLTLPANVDYTLLGHLFDAAQAKGCRDKVMMYGAMIDDHCPFMEQGFPAIDLIDFQYGSAIGRNDYWHTSEDSLNKLSADSLQLVGDLVLDVINRIQNSPEPSLYP